MAGGPETTVYKESADFMFVLYRDTMRVSLVSLLYILGQIPRQLDRLQSWAFAFGALTLLLIALDLRPDLLVNGISSFWGRNLELSLLAFGFGLAKRASVGVFSTVYLLHLGAVFAAMLVHYQGDSGFLNRFALTSNVAAILISEMIITIVAMLAAGAAPFILRRRGLRRASLGIGVLLLIWLV
jgi:hypothetical protein